jgi:uncharacterized protein
MGQPVVHFEIIGKDPKQLRSYYGELFGWSSTRARRCRTRSPSRRTRGSWTATRRATGSGSRVGSAEADYDGHVIFYVGVPDVEAALQKAENLGGTRRMGPDRAPGRDLVVGLFTEPEGHLIGVAGTA